MTPKILDGQSVLITGGTRGFGKAVGIAFARAGATPVLTHRWGSTSEEELVAEFEAADLPAPIVCECDASDSDSNRETLELIKEKVGRLDAIVSNVAFSKVITDLDKLKKKSLDLSIGYSAWPVVDLVQHALQVFDDGPRYVIGVSSDGGEICHPGYDFAGTAKSVLETLCRYLALRLRPRGIRVNAIRPGFLDTDSSRATFGDDTVDAMKAKYPGLLLDPAAVAPTCVALASGLMDSVTGQVITVDEGWSLVSPMALLSGDAVPGAFPRDDGSGT